LNNCRCNNESSTFRCDKFGTFTASDVNCINASIPAEGSIIPFSSGISLSRVANVFGNIEASLLGFGTASNIVPIISNTINLTSFFTEAFAVPRDGKITAISAAFAPLVGVVDGSVTIRAQIFLAHVGSNIFTGTSASVDLVPSITQPIPLNLLVFASATIPPIPVTTGDRLLMVFYLSSVPGETAEDIIVGNASAGINIV